MDMNNRKITKKYMIAGIAGVIFLTILDQLSKLWAIHTLKGQPSIVWVKGVFELQYLENRGAAFGLMQNQQWLFLICYRLPAGKRYAPLRVIAVFVSAGAIGNAIDRLFRGFVVDFFYFSLIDFPVFNVADIYVSVSMAFFLLLFLFYYKEDEFQGLFSRKKTAIKG